MLFNSYIFVFVFFPIVLLGYYILNKYGKYRLGEVFLLFMSLIFYGTFEITSILILGISILVNYGISIVIRKGKRKDVLIAGIFFNIIILGAFKYTNFLFSNVNNLLNLNISTIEWIVPIGLSFMTFQQISYIVDVYRDNNIRYSLLEYSLYVMFFPYVISGPIVRHNFLIPQFREEDRKEFNEENFAKGVYGFAVGLAKKVLLADTLAKVVNIGFANVYGLNTTTAIITILSYTMQIYFDFSGYSDMVIGIGKMLNFDMPINFNSPYKATNILEFWKRWHMSLTSFLTEYVYFPLGGNRKGKKRTYLNVFLVFLISGLWHGSNWTYIVWGALHGGASVLNRVFKKKIDDMNQIASWLLLFLFVNFTWIFFRASSIGDAIAFIKALGTCDFGPISPELVSAFIIPEFGMMLDLLFSNVEIVSRMLLVITIVIMILGILTMKNTVEKIEEFRPTNRKIIVTTILLVWSIISFSGVTSFIYVNF